MRISEQTIKAAFRRHFEVYAQKKGWSIPYHIQQWNTASMAFQNRSLSDFEVLYEELRRRWQIFRGVKGRPSAGNVFKTLLALDTNYAHQRLSALQAGDAANLWRVISPVTSVKRLKDGRPSVVAVSKFLHFWNPRLFIIVDYARIRTWVFGHSWLWDGVETKSAEVKRAVTARILNDSDFNTDMGYYPSILLWAGDVMQANSCIVQEFSRYVQSNAGSIPLPEDLREYEAAAIEWFLLGLVELPPKGVEVQCGH
jgi:hypothetical protein